MSSCVQYAVLSPRLKVINLNILPESSREAEAFFLPEIFEKVNFDPYNFRITILSARKSEQMENF